MAFAWAAAAADTEAGSGRTPVAADKAPVDDVAAEAAPAAAASPSPDSLVAAAYPSSFADAASIAAVAAAECLHLREEAQRLA